MQSRIPNVGSKRLKTDTRMLKDVTNTRYLYQRGNSNNNKKLTFGDETSIELVKTRQRKILGDINQLNQAIYEINKSIANLKDDELITLRQDTQLLNNEIISMKSELEENETEIQSVEDEIISLRQREKMWVENETLKYKIESQDKFNQLDMIFNEERTKLEREMSEFVESFIPPRHLTESICEYTGKLEQYNKEWSVLTKDNDVKLVEREDNILKCELTQFQQEKTDKLGELKQSNDAFHNQLISIQSKSQEYRCDIDTLTAEIVRYQDDIKSMESEITNLTTQTIPPLQTQLESIDTTLQQSTTSLKQWQYQSTKVKDEWQCEHNKLQREKTRNQALVESIART